MTDLRAAMNYTYYIERLADPTLLESALITDCGDLAVPARGTRRGGWTTVESAAEGERLIARMRERPADFPDPRLIYDDECVEFGPETPDDDVAAGLHYGYSESAIAAFMRKMAREENDHE